MGIGLPELPTLLIVLLGAFIGGFTTGFAGFGTGLVSSGLWFHVLPAPFVPPLVALASVAAQIVGLISLRKSFEWRRVYPYLAGAVIGVPLGVWLLKLVSPDNLKLLIGVFLVIYAVYLLFFAKNLKLRNRGGKTSDGMIGAGGGFLGGFAGLSGPAASDLVTIARRDERSAKGNLPTVQSRCFEFCKSGHGRDRTNEPVSDCYCLILPAGHITRRLDGLDNLPRCQ